MFWVEDLCFSYFSQIDWSGFFVGLVDLMFCWGEVVYIVGYNGSGKFMFLWMFCGFYWVESGCIFVDGEFIEFGDLFYLCVFFGMIFVDYYLFVCVVDGIMVDVVLKVLLFFDEMGLIGKIDLIDGWFIWIVLLIGQKKWLVMVVVCLCD